MFLPWNRNIFHFLCRNWNLITPWEKASSALTEVRLTHFKNFMMIKVNQC